MLQENESNSKLKKWLELCTRFEGTAETGALQCPGARKNYVS